MFPSPRAEARAGRAAGRRRRPHRPVFVDDSGRRHRLMRMAGITSGGLAFAYLVIVAATFAGVPGLGRLEAPGLGELTNPAGDRADVGPDPLVQAAPEVVSDLAGSGPGVAPGATDGSEAVASTTTAPAAATTSSTTTVHGAGSTTTAPTPSSTVPDRGGPPTSQPGRP
jgi:hypothetical protein